VRRSTAILTSALALAGCAVGPNFTRPGPPAIARYTADPTPAATAGTTGPQGARQALAVGAAVEGRWWTRFSSPELDRLMDRALANNADVAAARAALRAAREVYLAQRGSLYPTLDFQSQNSRNRSSAALSPPLNNNDLNYSLFSNQFNLSYTLDLFGGVRRAVEATAAQAQQQRYQTEATYLTLTNNLVGGYVQLASLRAQIVADEQLKQDALRLLQLTVLQRTQGQVSGFEYATAATQLAQAEGALPTLRKAAAQQLDLLAALSGETPSELGAINGDLDTLTLPGGLPVSLPAQLVDQRPDLRSAEAAVHAAAAQVGVALANRLPNLTITGNAGGVSTRIEDVLSHGNSTFSIVGGLTQAIFDGGTLKHRQRQAEALLDQAREQYRSTLLTAVQNVADVLSAVTTDADGLVSAQAADAAARRGLRVATLQNAYGQTSGMTRLNAEVVALQADLTLRQARAARLADSVALYVALGGGWWNRADLSPSSGGHP